MIQTAQKHAFVHYVDGMPTEVLSWDQVKALTGGGIAPVIPPPAEGNLPNPTKPVDVITDPVKLEPIPAAAPRSEFVGTAVGTRAGNTIYESVNRDCYLEEVEKYLLPRGTNMVFDRKPGVSILSGNPNPAGVLGVPARFTLPRGWGWGQFGDKAWFIVPEETAVAAPAWLGTQPDAPANAPQATQPGSGAMHIGNLFKNEKTA